MDENDFMSGRPHVDADLRVCPPTGIDFASIDGQPVRIAFMIFSPVNHITEHTQILTTLSKLISQESVRDQLLKANSTHEYHSVITSRENG
jgi:fructose PTS system EIIBC or EIIC component